MEIKIKGKASFRSIDLGCEKCGYEEERTIDLRGLDEAQIEQAMNEEIQCPNCGNLMVRVWKKAPMSRVGGEGSDREVSEMKKNFNERFVKKELSDVRHKFGKLYDDSVRSAAAQRIKKGEK